MPQEIKKVYTVKVDFKCPKCNNGYLRPNGRCLTAYPPKFTHNCNNSGCDYSETFSNRQYPYYDYISDDSNEADA